LKENRFKETLLEKKEFINTLELVPGGVLVERPKMKLLGLLKRQPSQDLFMLSPSPIIQGGILPFLPM
jgi:hypothetical protein